MGTCFGAKDDALIVKQPSRHLVNEEGHTLKGKEVVPDYSIP